MLRLGWGTHQVRVREAASRLRATERLQQGVSGRLPLHDGRLDLFRRREDEDAGEALIWQAGQRPSQVLHLPVNHVGTEGPTEACVIALAAEPFGQVEDDRDRGQR